ncbi:hypothetical protein [Thalassotalea mangrovi]|uniref:Acyloxyacyl hydrolase n=1 Tax=Thalassotalea mangrovi TaxID=2572245 RepID=A0A4U1B796_9GAMM|nr:hypothetical protein [Thalassotalea mangrovi]TKB46381.1 hypothetical protein E8M12_04830 [Thalassotalea mangrovi]
MVKLTALLFALFSCSTIAMEFEVKLGGWSDHLKKNDTEAIIREFIDPEFEYNENHKGYGVKWYFYELSPKWQINLEVWHMRDSHDMDYDSIGLGFTRDFPLEDSFLDKISLSMPITYVDRSDILYSDTSAEFIRKEFVHFMPYLSFYKKGFHVDFTVLPHDTNTGFSITAFARLGYRF